MKVAQLLYSGLGGHGSVAFSLISGDTERTWTNALCFIGIEPMFPAYAEQCAEAGIPYRYVPTRPGQPWRSWRAVREWLEAERPDALIIHSSTALPTCLRFGARRNIPIIVVEHTPAKIKRRRDWLLSAVATRFADRMIVLSESYGAEMERRLGRILVRSKMAVVPNGVDTDLFSPPHQRHQNKSAAIRIGMAGRFTLAKRQDLLIHLLDMLRKNEGRHEWQLGLAGDGQELDTVRNLAAELGQDQISFKGMLAEADLARWLQTLDIYVHASDGETQSTAILQAMASAQPVVASDVEGIREQVESSFGVTLANDDLDSWARTLSALADDPEQRAAMGRNARRRCKESFSARAMYQGYDALIRELLDRRDQKGVQRGRAVANTSS